METTTRVVCVAKSRRLGNDMTDHTHTTTRTHVREPEWGSDPYWVGHEHGKNLAQGILQMEGKPEPAEAQAWLDAYFHETVRWEFDTPNPLDEFYEVYDCDVNVWLSNDTECERGIKYSTWCRRWCVGFHAGWLTTMKYESINSIVESGNEVDYRD